MDSRYEEGDRRIHALGTMGEIDKNTLWAWQALGARREIDEYTLRAWRTLGASNEIDIYTLWAWCTLGIRGGDRRIRALGMMWSLHKEENTFTYHLCWECFLFSFIGLLALVDLLTLRVTLVSPIWLDFKSFWRMAHLGTLTHFPYEYWLVSRTTCHSKLKCTLELDWCLSLNLTSMKHMSKHQSWIIVQFESNKH